MNLYKVTILLETDSQDPTEWIVESIEEQLEFPEKIRGITTVNMDPEIWG